MTVLIETAIHQEIHTAEVVWGNPENSNVGAQQEHCLIELIELSTIGLVLDCSQVEYGSPEFIDMLMRVRTHAKANGKHIALFNVSLALKNRIGLSNLRLALPAVKNAAAAGKLISKLAGIR